MIHLLLVYGHVILPEVFLASGFYLTWSLALRVRPGPVYLRSCVSGVALRFWLLFAISTGIGRPFLIFK